MPNWLGKIRPQVLAIGLGLIGLGAYALSHGFPEVAATCVGGLIAVAMELTKKD